jgi:hypothetical protein
MDGTIAMISLMRIVVSTILLLGINLSPQPAWSHSGDARDPWNPAHLSNLPPDIRAEALKWNAACGGSIAAAQQFALYLTVPGAQFVALHYDDFRCRNKAVQCDSSGCLHEVYVATNGGHYRRVLRVHARDIRMSRDHDMALIEISDGAGTKLLRWSGGRFVGP